jgi:hypothetical protein
MQEEGRTKGENTQEKGSAENAGQRNGTGNGTGKDTRPLIEQQLDVLEVLWEEAQTAPAELVERVLQTPQFFIAAVIVGQQDPAALAEWYRALEALSVIPSRLNELRARVAEAVAAKAAEYQEAGEPPPLDDPPNEI